jgi:tetratricopeptide (TPR) repeat protein
VLRLQPRSQSAAEGRARVALAANEDDAVAYCRKALAFHDDHPERQLRMIITVAGELGVEAIPLFEDYIKRHPTSPQAHQFLSDLRAENGEDESFVDHYRASLSHHPTNKPLLMSYWDTLTRAGRLEEALDSMHATRHLFEGDRSFQLLEINTANHAGLTERAGQLLGGLDERPDAQLPRAQHRLQIGDAAEAGRLLEGITAAQPDNLTAWALLEVAWRATSDPRHDWLVGNPRLYRSMDLSLKDSELQEIAAVLRTMHKAQAQPLGQSVRGGTQTPGQLFLRTEPQLAVLISALTDSIRSFVDQLPSADPAHPLLKHRTSGLAFGPSWSVRLTDGGFHAAHFHPSGIISSACYVSLPDAVRTGAEQEGWLEIGRPPPELALSLEPLEVIEPVPGRLVLFPSFLFHGTRPFAAGERLTVAFDLVPVPFKR